MMKAENENGPALWRLIVVGGHTRNIGKTQLVCDIIRTFPKASWIAGKITQHEHEPSVATQPPCLFEWETHPDSGADSARFLKAGAVRSFWLRSRHDSLGACIGNMSQSLQAAQAATAGSRKLALIIESNSLVQVVQPSLYFAVIDPDKEDFKESARSALSKSNALVLRAPASDPDAPPAPLWLKLPPELLQQRPSVIQRIGEPLPKPLESFINQMLDDPPSVAF